MEQAPRAGPLRIGPYHVVETLGRGGMGIVYRARHEASGEEVALKTIRVPQAGLLASIRREIHALARIRHEGIVRIRAEGVDDGLPWYAMELLEGATLRALLGGEAGSSDGGGTPTRTIACATVAATSRSPADDGFPVAASIPPPAHRAELLAILAKLCATLGYLHRLGIVHRDLKPENVLVRPGGQPVLVDFGLSSTFMGDTSRDPLHLGGDHAGTIAYMSPEQARGELVDPRSDLYAVGCLLYEIVAGRPPFIGDDIHEILRQHASTPPVPPSRLAPDVAPELEALVLRLLAKRPMDRLGYADDVVLALSGSRAARAGTASGAFLFRPALVGRAELLRRLRGMLWGATTEGKMVLVTGEAGVGKTRLLVELSAEARGRGTRVLMGQCEESVGPGADATGRPLAVLRPVLAAVADLCRERGPEETARLLGRRGAVLRAYEGTLGALPGQEAYVAPPPLPPAAARLRLFSYLAETLGELDPGRPLLLVLDDLHWADALTLDFLAFLLESGALERTPLSLVLAARSDEPLSNLGRLRAQDGLELLELPRLGQLAVQEMIRDMLGDADAPPELLARFYEETEGNPFIVGEYLRTAVGEGLVAREPGGRWQVAGSSPDSFRSLGLPRTVRDLVARRLEALGPEAAKLVPMAAVMGRQLAPDLWERIAGAREDEFLDGCAELLARHVIEELPGGHLAFAHDKLRQVAYERIDPELRSSLHGRVADALAAAHGEEHGGHLADLAVHRERAGDLPAARATYLGAARWVAGNHALVEAERLYRSYLRLADRPDPVVRLELGEQVLEAGGRYREAAEEHELARQEAAAAGDEPLVVRALSALAYALDRTGEVARAGLLFEEALAMARRLHDPKAQGRILQRLGVWLQRQGRIDEAVAIYGQALDAVRAEAVPANEASVLANLASIDMDRGATGRARQLYEQALALARRAADRRLEGMVIGNLATLEHERGDLTAAEDLYGRALALQREIGNRASEGLLLSNIGICKHQRRRLAEARELYEQALRLARELADPRGEATNLNYLATLALDEGRFEQAQKLAERASTLHRRLSDRAAEGATLVLLARIDRLGAAGGASSELLARAVALLGGLDDTLALAECYCELGHTALHLGQDAGPALAKAEALARQRGAGPGGELGQKVAHLRRCLDARAAGVELARGELPAADGG